MNTLLLKTFRFKSTLSIVKNIKLIFSLDRSKKIIHCLSIKGNNELQPASIMAFLQTVITSVKPAQITRLRYF